MKTTSGLSTHREQVKDNNLAWAKSRFPAIAGAKLDELAALSGRYGVSGAAGDIILFEQHWYITHGGLLGIARKRNCRGINTSLQRLASNPEKQSWVFKAIVYKSQGSKGFVGFGDANPSNVSPKVHGSEMRIAETRAVNRALRKAYAVGICSYEELGPQLSGNGKGVSKADAEPPTLRERLCAIVSQNSLNAGAVKRYAAEFCGTQQLRDASRELVEDFITHVSLSLARDRDGFLARLQQYENGSLQ